MFLSEKFKPGQFVLAAILGLALLLSGRATAASVTIDLQGNANPAVTGYEVYCGTTSGDYTNQFLVGDVTNVTIAGLVPGLTYYFAATSHDAQNQQSAFSPEISYPVPFPITNEPPIITAMQAANVAIAGQDITFAVRAFGNSPLSYQWMYEDNGLAAATNAVLILTNVVSSQSGAYSVNVSDSTGATNSPTVNLTVYPTAAATLTSESAVAGPPAMQVCGITNDQYVIEASTDLVNWVSIATNVSPFTFTDNQAGEFKYRFYRSYLNPTTTPSDNPANSLVAWYPLAGNLNDDSVNANNGIGVGTIAYTAGPLNVANTALAFDGTDTSVYANNTSSYVTNSTAISITGWVHPNDYNINYAGFGLRSPSDGPGAFYINLLANGQYQGRFRNSSGTAVDLAAAYATGSWIFVGLTYDGSTLTLYTNGVAAASLPASGNFGVGNLPLYIGATGYTPTSSLPDYPMAGIRLYNTALSASAMQQLYNNGINNGTF